MRQSVWRFQKIWNAKISQSHKITKLYVYSSTQLEQDEQLAKTFPALKHGGDI